MNVISNVWNGRFGMAKTYWLWGVLSGIPWGLVLSLVTPGSNLAILGLLALVAYYVIVNVGIWRAASQYQGIKAWAILAKVAVAITPVCLIISMLAAIIIPATYQSSTQRQQVTTATKQDSMFLFCTLSSPSGTSHAYTFEFNQSKNHLQWIEGTKEFNVIHNTESQLWANHYGRYRPFIYDQTSFQLNRASGGLEIFYSRKPTLEEIAACKNSHNFGCDSWLVLTEHTETGICNRQERQV